MKPINLKTLLEAANNNNDFLDHRIRVVELYMALKSKIDEGKTVRISTTRKTHILSQETGLTLDSMENLLHYNRTQRISVQGIISIEVLGEPGQVVDGYRFQESIPEHVRRLGESIRFVTNARAVLLKKLYAKKDGADLTASKIKDLHREISWEMADMTIEELMDALCVMMQDGDTLASS